MDEITVEVVNLTGHSVSLGPSAKTLFKFPSRGQVRIEPHYEQVVRAHLLFEGKETGVAIPVLYAENGRPTSVPDPKPNTLYVVSGMVESGVDRDDFVCAARVTRNTARQVDFARALLTHTEMERWRQSFTSEV